MNLARAMWLPSLQRRLFHSSRHLALNGQVLLDSHPTDGQLSLLPNVYEYMAMRQWSSKPTLWVTA